MLAATVAVYIIIFIVFAYFIWRLHRSGLFDTITVCVTDNPPVLSKSMTIYYKHHIGRYNRMSTLYQEAKSLIPKDGTLFAIYYDDPEELKEHLLQSAVGVLFGEPILVPVSEEGEDYYSEEYGEKLKKWGYERMVLPKIDRAVVSTQKFDGYFSIFTLKNYTYPKVNTFLKKHGLTARLAVEAYSNKQIHVLIPLDHHDDFIISELMTVQEIENKLAQSKMVNDSESECDSEESTTDEDEGSAMSTGGEDETNGELKKNE